MYMKIYVNKNHEIKAIYSTTDETFIEYEINRSEVFGDKSDFMILNYCYKETEYGYSIYPARNYSDIVEEDYRLKVDESRKKISILEAENEILKQELSLTQDAVNEILFMMVNLKGE